ncbi:MAG: TPM domain-containing protein [Bacteroidia bacterium]|nr:TPM domain-containing protein [Bacteroidia bacterium]HQU99990.1 TPM domain-containing protein [Bacteroidia bacterium]
MKLTILISSLCILSTNVHAQLLLKSSDGKNDMVAIPISKGYINDREKIFSETEKNQIRDLMIKFRFDSNTISILTVAEIDPFENIQALAVAYANGWELGWGNKNGVLFVFSKSKQKSTVQIGEALAKKISTDQLNYLDRLMIQQFVQNNYAQGVINALSELNQILIQTNKH